MQKSGNLFVCSLVLLTAGLLLIGAPVNAQTCGVSQPLQLVSVALDGTPGGGTMTDVNNISLSADGRYIAFTSHANNLVNGDTNQKRDVFVRDMVTGVTERVSVGPNGVEANGESRYPSLSGDGNLVAFESEATNLVPDITCPGLGVDTFVYDRQTKTTIPVATVAGSNLSDCYSYRPTISGNGRYVAFISGDANLVPGDTNGKTDVLVRDLTTGTIERVSVSSTGAEGNNNTSYDSIDISWDGRYVSFESFASNLVENDYNAQCDHTYYYFPDDPCLDVFVHDRVTHETKRASVASDGTETNGSAWNHSLSQNGQYISFVSSATNLAPQDTDNDWDVFVHDLDSSTSEVVSVLEGVITIPSGFYPSLSFYGRYLAFTAPTNAFSIVVRDTWTNQNIQVSRAMNGQIENGQAFYPVISADGQHVVFWSNSSNLVVGDTNNEGDIFVAALNCPADRTPFTPSPPDAVPTRNYSTGDITLTWNRIPWAAQYRIQVATDKAFQPEFIVNELVGADQLEKTLTGLNPNTYYWRVQALDATGKAGGWSAVESFTIGYPNP